MDMKTDSSDKNSKSSFADIYSQWMQTHDEDAAISKRLKDRSQNGSNIKGSNSPPL